MKNVAAVMIVVLAGTLGWMGCQTASRSASRTASDGILEQILSGKGRVVDLTHPLHSSIPRWPGAKPFRFDVLWTIEKNGAYLGYFEMPEHLGTHVDAPRHFIADGTSIDALEPRQLIAPAAVIDVRAQVAEEADYRLTVTDIKRWEEENGTLPPGAVVFMYTGWGARWNDPEAYRHQDERGVMHFPGFSPEAAQFLVRERAINGLGIDTLSVDYGPSTDYRVHHIALGAGKYHIENAANLDQLPAKGAVVIVAPLPIRGGSGAPARVLALVEH